MSSSSNESMHTQLKSTTTVDKMNAGKTNDTTTTRPIKIVQRKPDGEIDKTYVNGPGAAQLLEIISKHNKSISVTPAQSNAAQMVLPSAEDSCKNSAKDLHTPRDDSCRKTPTGKATLQVSSDAKVVVDPGQSEKSKSETGNLQKHASAALAAQTKAASAEKTRVVSSQSIPSSTVMHPVQLSFASTGERQAVRILTPDGKLSSLFNFVPAGSDKSSVVLTPGSSIGSSASTIQLLSNSLTSAHSTKPQTKMITVPISSLASKRGHMPIAASSASAPTSVQVTVSKTPSSTASVAAEKSRGPELAIRPRPPQPLCVIVPRTPLCGAKSQPVSLVPPQNIFVTPTSLPVARPQALGVDKRSTVTVLPLAQGTPVGSVPSTATRSQKTALLSSASTSTVTAVLPAGSLQVASSSIAHSPLIINQALSSLTPVSGGLHGLPTFLLVAPASTTSNPSTQTVSTSSTQSRGSISVQSSRAASHAQSSAALSTASSSTAVRYVSSHTVNTSNQVIAGAGVPVATSVSKPVGGKGNAPMRPLQPKSMRFVLPPAFANQLVLNPTSTTSAIGVAGQRGEQLASSTSKDILVPPFRKLVISRNSLNNLNKISREGKSKGLRLEQVASLAVSSSQTSNTSQAAISSDKLSAGDQTVTGPSVAFAKNTRLATASIPRQSYLKMLRDSSPIEKASVSLISNKQSIVKKRQMQNSTSSQSSVNQVPISGPVFVTTTLRTGSGPVSVQVMAPNLEDDSEASSDAERTLPAHPIRTASTLLRQKVTESRTMLDTSNMASQTLKSDPPDQDISSSKQIKVLELPLPNLSGHKKPPADASCETRPKQDDNGKDDSSETDSDYGADSEEQDLRVLGQLLGRDSPEAPADAFIDAAIQKRSDFIANHNDIGSKLSKDSKLDHPLSSHVAKRVGGVTGASSPITNNIHSYAKMFPSISGQLEKNDSNPTAATEEAGESLGLRIESVFSLNSDSRFDDMVVQQSENFHPDRGDKMKDLATTPPFLTGQSDSTVCHGISDSSEHGTEEDPQCERESVMTPCFSVLERLSAIDLERLSSPDLRLANRQVGSQCSEHCRKRTLKYMCDLNLLPCESRLGSPLCQPENDYGESKLNDDIDDVIVLDETPVDRCVPTSKDNLDLHNRCDKVTEKSSLNKESDTENTALETLDKKTSEKEPLNAKGNSSCISSLLGDKTLKETNSSVFHEPCDPINEPEVSNIDESPVRADDINEKTNTPGADGDSGPRPKPLRRHKVGLPNSTATKPLCMQSRHTFAFRVAMIKLKKQVELKRHQMRAIREYYVRQGLRTILPTPRDHNFANDSAIVKRKRRVRGASIGKRQNWLRVKGSRVSNGQKVSQHSAGPSSMAKSEDIGTSPSKTQMPPSIFAQVLPPGLIYTTNATHTKPGAKMSSTSENNKVGTSEVLKSPLLSESPVKSPQSQVPPSLMSNKITESLKSLDGYLKATGRQLSGIQSQHFLLKIDGQYVLVRVPPNQFPEGAPAETAQPAKHKTRLPDSTVTELTSTSAPSSSRGASTSACHVQDTSSSSLPGTCRPTTLQRVDRPVSDTPVATSAGLKRKATSPVKKPGNKAAKIASPVGSVLHESPPLVTRPVITTDQSLIHPQSQRSATLMIRGQNKHSLNLRSLLTGQPAENVTEKPRSQIDVLATKAGNDKHHHTIRDILTSAPAEVTQTNTSTTQPEPPPSSGSIVNTERKALVYADPLSDLSHLPSNSHLLPTPNRDKLQKLSKVDRASRRAALEKKYPLPPGVIIKTEPEDSEDTVDANWSVASELRVVPSLVDDGAASGGDFAVGKRNEEQGEEAVGEIGTSTQNVASEQNMDTDTCEQRLVLPEANPTDTAHWEPSFAYVDDSLDEPPPLLEEVTSAQRTRRGRRRRSSRREANEEQPPVLQPMCTTQPPVFPTVSDDTAPSLRASENISCGDPSSLSVDQADADTGSARENTLQSTGLLGTHTQLELETPLDSMAATSSAHKPSENICLEAASSLPMKTGSGTSQDTPGRAFKATEVSSSKNIRIQRLKELLRKKEQEIETMRKMRLELPPVQLDN